MVCFQSYVLQNLVKRDRFWGFFVLENLLLSNKVAIFAAYLLT